ncbi:MAG TPA: DUF2784 family protein [Candidatus Paceibacterota bacterium]
MGIYQNLADIVLWFHLFWIVLLVSSSLLYNTKRKLLQDCHLVAVMSTTIGQLAFLGCPLSALEMGLRARYNPETISGRESFIGDQLREWVGFSLWELSPEYIAMTLVGILLFSAFTIFYCAPKLNRWAMT